MTLSYTKNLHLAVPDFMTEPWHGEFAQAMDSIDRILYQTIILNESDLWLNSHVYVIGDVVINPDSGGLFSCAVAHTSTAAPQTFTQELVAHPTFWTSFVVILATQAEAEAGTDNTKYMSPLRVAQAIDQQAPTASIASQLEAEVGVDNTQLMTPLRTAQSIAVRANALPQGRLTLVSLTPVMLSSVLNANVMYYTPYVGTLFPMCKASFSFSTFDLGDEIASAISDATHNPGPIAALKVYDWFIWETEEVVTLTIAGPCIVTYAGHGLLAGMPFRFITDGVLPGGVNPGQFYWVLPSGLSANSFQFSGVKGGAPVNAVGSQSGTHRALIGRLCHGPAWTNDTTRSAGSEIVRHKGIWVNVVAITNGPAALRGVYVGTARSDTNGNFAWQFGTHSTGSLQLAILNVWNTYNRVIVATSVRESAGTWAVPAGVVQPLNNSIGNRVYAVFGLGEDPVAVRADATGLSINAAGYVSVGVALNSTTAMQGTWGTQQGVDWGPIGGQATSPMPIGFNWWQALEWSDQGGSIASGPPGSLTGMHYIGRM